jgi:hypothetical protein
VTIRTVPTDPVGRPPLGHLLPLYVYPANLPGRQGRDEWDVCLRSRFDAPTYVIANVADGVADPRAPWSGVDSPGPGAWAVMEATTTPRPTSELADPVYRDVIAQLACRGVDVLGYVDTGYGHTPLGTPGSADPATVLGQARLWFELYPGICGVFLDQVPTSGSPAERRTIRAVTDRVPGIVVANSGQLPGSEWLFAAGADLVVYENYLSEFLTLELPAWTASVAPATLGAILHDAESPAEVQQACSIARAIGVGLLYVTDGRQESGNPYDGLPSPAFWSARLDSR